MKKFFVSVIIIGAFMLYSFIYHLSSTVAALPGNTTKSSSSSSSYVPTPTPASTLPPSTVAQITPTPTSAPGGLYKNGLYTGSVADAHWGYIQVKVIVTNGKIADVQFLQYPNDRNRSVEINQYADPQLTSEAIQVQSANVDIVSGATDSSDAFIQSLTTALTQAKA
ncbi:MAG: FMN-binding protein [Ktedonobacteraceae bacterium]|nr:FMN-binding protein [Ktedonobacteraceae bacterium]